METDSHLQSEREQLRYYSYSIKVANNSLPSRLTRVVVNSLEFSKFSNVSQIRSGDTLSSSKTEFRNQFGQVTYLELWAGTASFQH